MIHESVWFVRSLQYSPETTGLRPEQPQSGSQSAIEMRVKTSPTEAKSIHEPQRRSRAHTSTATHAQAEARQSKTYDGVEATDRKYMQLPTIKMIFS